MLLFYGALATPEELCAYRGLGPTGPHLERKIFHGCLTMTQHGEKRLRWSLVDAGRLAMKAALGLHPYYAWLGVWEGPSVDT